MFSSSFGNLICDKYGTKSVWLVHCLKPMEKNITSPTWYFMKFLPPNREKGDYEIILVRLSVYPPVHPFIKPKLCRCNYSASTGGIHSKSSSLEPSVIYCKEMELRFHDGDFRYWKAKRFCKNLPFLQKEWLIINLRLQNWLYFECWAHFLSMSEQYFSGWEKALHKLQLFSLSETLLCHRYEMVFADALLPWDGLSANSVLTGKKEQYSQVPVALFTNMD